MDDPSLTLTDAIVFGIILVSTLLAFARGFVLEVLSLGAWIGAALAAFFGFPVIQPIARDFVSSKLIADAGAIVAVFVVALIILSIIAGMISRTVRNSDLSMVDRFLGLLFGVARGVLVVCLIFFGITLFFTPRNHPDWLREAMTYSWLQVGAAFLHSLIPDASDGNSLFSPDGEASQEQRQSPSPTTTLEQIVAPASARSPAPTSDQENRATNSQQGYNGLDRERLEELIQNPGN